MIIRSLGAGFLESLWPPWPARATPPGGPKTSKLEHTSLRDIIVVELWGLPRYNQRFYHDELLNADEWLLASK